MGGNGSAFEFPSDIPVKIFGRNDDAFRDAVLAIVKTYFPELGKEDVAEQTSRRDRYLSITVTVWAENRAQIDALYTDLTAHDEILMVI